MKRKELLSLYTVDTTVDPKTGKKKKVTRYIGRHYRVKMEDKKRMLPLLWGMTVLLLAAFVLGGMINNAGSRTVWVLPFYMFCMLPLVYELLAAVRLTRMKEIITEVERADGIHTAEMCAVGLLVLGGLWTVTDIVFLLMGGAADNVARELIFLGCGLATVAGAWFLRKAVGMVTPEEIAEEAEDDGDVEDMNL